MRGASEASGLGLVEQVTSQTHFTPERIYAPIQPQRLRELYSSLNRERRVRHMRRCVVASAEASRGSFDRGGHRYVGVFVTLTYRPEVQYSPKHVSQYVDRVRKWLVRRGIALRYQWVVELTERGIPHYHCLFWLPHGTRLPKPDSSGAWPHGMSQIQLARKAVGYLVKYASKGTFDTHAFPRGARLFGCGNQGQDEKHVVSRARLPVWLNKASEPWQVPKRIAHVGFVCRESGEVFHSPYVLSVIRTDCGIEFFIELRNPTNVA